MHWSPAQYSMFEAERNRPIADLLARVPTLPVDRAVDLGCGPGNSTELLVQRYPGARVRGMDRSAEMVAVARERLPQVDFEVADLAQWQSPGPFDLILANAVLQWVPDHAGLLPDLLTRLTPGGSLAIQMPDNLDEPAHAWMRAVAGDGPWAERLAGAAAARTERHPAEWYFGLLSGHATRVDLWRTTYFHALRGGAAAVIAWFQGSGLRPFLEPLEAAERVAFLARYESRIATAYPASADGTVLLPFPRLFIVATR